MPNIVYIATSIDGFIARKDGSFDWLTDLPNPENSDYGFSEFLERIDGIIMGRNTYETVEKFKEWPYPKPVFVLTDTLKELPGTMSGKASIVRGELKTILESLNKQGFYSFYIDGGKTIQSFLKEDLIDEMTITRIPILLGSGIPLFNNTSPELWFEHVETRIHNNMLVKSKYLRKR